MKLMIFKICKVIILMLSLLSIFSIVNYYMFTGRLDDVCYGYASRRYCFYKLNRYFSIFGDESSGVDGVYFYEPITKRLITQGYRFSDSWLYAHEIFDHFHIMKIELVDDNIFLYKENGYIEILTNGDSKSVGGNDKFLGTYEFQEKYIGYFYDSNNCLLYDKKSKNVTLETYGIELFDDGNYVVSDWFVYSEDNDKFIGAIKISDTAPEYFNSQNLNIYNQKKKEFNMAFALVDESLGTSVREVYIDDGYAILGFDDDIYKEEIILLGWDQEYVYFGWNYNERFKYDIVNNKLTMDGYTEIDYSELKYIK